MLEEIVEKLFAAWMGSLKQEGRRVAEYALACYARSDPAIPL